ncbi:MAG TPA: hypothetical protein VN776_16660 [Terracidiphilus sp.]|nr:hypothetical protein [Terracidiphilus sp.]
MDVQTKSLPEGTPPEQEHAPSKADASQIFDLGNSGGSNIAADKDAMIAEAFDSLRRRGARSI